jgi:excisionase family DNA binding protein
MKNIHIPSLAFEASSTLPPPSANWAEVLAPLFEQLDQQSRRAAREEYIKLLAEQETTTAEARRNEEPLTVKQAAELLGITAQTAWEWQKRKVLTSYRIGRRIFFRRGEVLAALQAHTHQDGRRKYARQRGPGAGADNKIKNETAANA